MQKHLPIKAKGSNSKDRSQNLRSQIRFKRNFNADLLQPTCTRTICHTTLLLKNTFNYTRANIVNTPDA